MSSARSNPAKSISDTQEFLARKNAATATSCSNSSTTSDNEYYANGADSPIPELSFEGGWIQIDKCANNALARRTNCIEYKLVIFITGRTTSAARRPEYAEIEFVDYRRYTGASERAIYLALASLEAKRFIDRDGRGRVKVCPENFAALALPAARKCKPRVIEAEVRAAAPIAAYRAPAEPIAAEPNPETLKLTSVAEPAAAVAESAPASESLKLTSVEPEADCKKPETYCPWNWTCPHLSTTSELVSMKAVKHNYSTTTAAHAPAGENPYLARFLAPHTRIGDALEIDDAAAARMWRESVAVNPAITPREFVLVAGMKLQEWARTSDGRPGMRIRNVRGLLIRSMPNAVCGVLYLAAHEQAPAELARDRARALYILAGEASPRERAWALGILSESQT